jgi:hypothetical protein
MSSPTEFQWTRRQFAGGLAAWLGCSGSTKLHASTQKIEFGVFSLFEPRTIMLEAEEALRLVLGNGRYLLRPDMLPVRISCYKNERIVVYIGIHTLLGLRIDVAAASGGEANFQLAAPASIAHGSIRRRFQGALSLSAVAQCLQPVIKMDRETAVASIVAAESPADAPLSYLMAQAVATRSFLVAAGHCHTHFDFCDTTHCQYLRGPAPVGSSAFMAAARTQGRCLLFQRRPFAAMYSRSCSGRTHSLADLGLPMRDYPYYAVPCVFCQHHPETWQRTLGESISPNDERERLAFNQVHGWSAIPSSTFTQTRAHLEGRGVGHGLGLCQRGATAMAKQGASFDDILAHYYPNTMIGP